MQDNEDKDTSTDEVQTEHKKINKFRWGGGGGGVTAAVQTGPGAHPVFYTLGIVSLSWG
jgi:hypothetical protein